MTGMPWPRSPRPRQASAEEAVELIEVEYEVLPHVIDVEAAMAPGAPVLHDDMFTQGVEPKPTKPSNIAKKIAFTKGDIAKRLRRSRGGRSSGNTRPSRCIRPISSRMPASSRSPPTGRRQIWSSSQGQFMVRAYCAKLLGIDIANIRAMPAEIGGGFGGKTLVYLEPVALALSKKTGRPVKMVMNREEVFRGTGPTSGGSIEVKLGAKRTARIVAAELVLKYQAGAFAGSPVGPGCMCAFAMYDLDNVHITGYDVVSNRPKVAAYRAPGAPISSFGVESCIDELARELQYRPAGAARDERGASEGTKTPYGPTWSMSAISDTSRLLATTRTSRSRSARTRAAASPSGFWFNIGGEFERGGPRQRGRHRSASSRAIRISAARAPRWR